MPEGPSIVILKEQARQFEGQTIAAASGNSANVDFAALPGQPLLAVRSWGKHLLLELPLFSLRIHLLMFGSYRINERKPDAVPRLALRFEAGGELNFYTCSVRQIAAPLDTVYDWRVDVMADAWEPRLALRQLRAKPQMWACDALLDQNIFAGVGNIIKNEVLFRLRIHPLSKVKDIPATKLRELVKQARQYSFEFKAWKQAMVLKQHWLVHTRHSCPRCQRALQRAHLGLTRRRSFWCEHCQKRYDSAPDPQSVANEQKQ